MHPRIDRVTGGVGLLTSKQNNVECNLYTLSQTQHCLNTMDNAKTNGAYRLLVSKPLHASLKHAFSSELNGHLSTEILDSCINNKNIKAKSLSQFGHNELVTKPFKHGRHARTYNVQLLH